jgi:hypothetical protein
MTVPKCMGARGILASSGFEVRKLSSFPVDQVESVLNVAAKKFAGEGSE